MSCWFVCWILFLLRCHVSHDLCYLFKYRADERFVLIKGHMYPNFQNILPPNTSHSAHSPEEAKQTDTNNPSSPNNTTSSDWILCRHACVLSFPTRLKVRT